MAFQDSEIIEALHGDERQRSPVLRYLYKSQFDLVRHFVIQNSGTQDDAHDVFQEGIIALHHNVVTGRFNRGSAVSTYLFSICRFIWLKKLRKQKMTIALEYEHHADEQLWDNPADGLSEDLIQKLHQVFSRLGEVCQRILTLAYYRQLSMADIAKLTGFKDEQNARNKKLKCMKALKEYMNDANIHLSS